MPNPITTPVVQWKWVGDSQPPIGPIAFRVIQCRGVEQTLHEHETRVDLLTVGACLTDLHSLLRYRAMELVTISASWGLVTHHTRLHFVRAKLEVVGGPCIISYGFILTEGHLIPLDQFRVTDVRAFGEFDLDIISRPNSRNPAPLRFDRDVI